MLRRLADRAFEHPLVYRTLSVWVTDRATHTIYEQLTNLCPFEVTMDGMSRPDYD